MTFEQLPMKRRLDLANELSALWIENQESMGEMAAYLVACEQLQIDPDDGWDFLAELRGAE